MKTTIVSAITDTHISHLRIDTDPGTELSLYVAWEETGREFITPLLPHIVLPTGELELDADLTIPTGSALIAESDNEIVAHWKP